MEASPGCWEDTGFKYSTLELKLVMLHSACSTQYSRYCPLVLIDTPGNFLADCAIEFSDHKDAVLRTIKPREWKIQDT